MKKTLLVFAFSLMLFYISKHHLIQYVIIVQGIVLGIAVDLLLVMAWWGTVGHACNPCLGHSMDVNNNQFTDFSVLYVHFSGNFWGARGLEHL